MIDQLIDELLGAINRHRMENDLSYAETIGALELIKEDLIQELREEIANEEESF